MVVVATVVVWGQGLHGSRTAVGRMHYRWRIVAQRSRAMRTSFWSERRVVCCAHSAAHLSLRVIHTSRNSLDLSRSWIP